MVFSSHRDFVNLVVVVSPAALLNQVSQVASPRLGPPGLKHETMIQNKYITMDTGNTEHNNKTTSAITTMIM